MEDNSRKISLPHFEASDLTPYWESDADSHSASSAHHPATVSAFTAVSQNNQAVSEKLFDGTISVVSFFFAQCGSTCPLLMHSLHNFQKKLKQEGLASKVGIYSFSVTPETDTPEILKIYAKSHGFDLSNWTFLTGSRSEIYRVGKEVFKADRSVGSQKSESSFIHSENIYLLDSERQIRGIYLSSKNEDMALLMQDILKLEH